MQIAQREKKTPQEQSAAHLLHPYLSCIRGPEQLNMRSSALLPSSLCSSGLAAGQSRRHRDFSSVEILNGTINGNCGGRGGKRGGREVSFLVCSCPQHLTDRAYTACHGGHGSSPVHSSYSYHIYAPPTACPRRDSGMAPVGRAYRSAKGWSCVVGNVHPASSSSVAADFRADIASPFLSHCSTLRKEGNMGGHRGEKM